MTAITLIICTIVAFFPTIDGQRVEYGYHEPPYWLGLSVPIDEAVDITIDYNGSEMFLDGFTGTNWNLAYIDTLSPVLFYESNCYVGGFIPEPATAAILAIGTIFMRKKKQNNPPKHRH